MASTLKTYNNELSLLSSNSWNAISMDGRSSTVAHFRGGWENEEKGIQILVWTGIEQIYNITSDGEVLVGTHEVEKSDVEIVEEGIGVYFENYEWDMVTNSMTYIVEIIKDGEIEQEKLCRNYDEVNYVAEKFSKGEITLEDNSFWDSKSERGSEI